MALYDPARHGVGGLTGLAYGALSLWHLGMGDTALARVEQTVALARRFGRLFYLAWAFVQESSVLRFVRRESELQRQRAAELIALSEAQAFPFFQGIGHVHHGAARVAAGDVSGLSEILDGLARLADTESRVAAPGLAGILAEAQRSAGLLAEAQTSVAAGLALSAQTGQHYTDADLHRLEGELLLAQGGASDAGAERYQQALATARAQDSRALELRAATSLARLWHGEGRSAEARALLAPLYGWFTEGHGTGDLIEAKALLDELR